MSKTASTAQLRPAWPRPARAANENRRVVLRLRPPKSITTVEIEVFGVFLAECATANDNPADTANVGPA